MDKLLTTIERVCWKRHARLMQTMSEQEAAQHIADYLGHLKIVWAKKAYVLARLDGLQQGFQIKGTP